LLPGTNLTGNACDLPRGAAMKSLTAPAMLRLLMMRDWVADGDAAGAGYISSGRSQLALDQSLSIDVGN
jgi:hypothetical protein